MSMLILITATSTRCRAARLRGSTKIAKMRESSMAQWPGKNCGIEGRISAGVASQTGRIEDHQDLHHLTRVTCDVTARYPENYQRSDWQKRGGRMGTFTPIAGHLKAIFSAMSVSRSTLPGVVLLKSSFRRSPMSRR